MRGRAALIELSLNEVESLAAKAARGAGFAWGLADDIGRAARRLAQEGAEWGTALLALLERAPGFAGPGEHRLALWRRGGLDMREAKLLCPVRVAAFFNDAPPEIRFIVLHDVGSPIWLDALLKTQGLWRVEADLLGESADVMLRRSIGAAQTLARRATITRAAYDALSAYAGRINVPESQRSRTRGAGGGRVDDE